MLDSTWQKEREDSNEETEELEGRSKNKLRKPADNRVDPTSTLRDRRFDPGERSTGSWDAVRDQWEGEVHSNLPEDFRLGCAIKIISEDEITWADRFKSVVEACSGDEWL